MSEHRGPAPAVAREAVSARQRSCLEYLVGQPGATVADVHAAVGGHANSARASLEALVALGMATADATADGPGRPPVRYTATPLGIGTVRDTSGVTPSQSLPHLLDVLLEEFSQDPQPVAAARAVGRRWAGRLAPLDGPDPAAAPPAPADAPARAALRALLEGQGYAPEDRAGDIALLRCPLLEAATAHPDVVCAIHEGLLDEVYQRNGGQGRVQLLPFAAPDACLCRIQPAGGAPAPV